MTSSDGKVVLITGAGGSVGSFLAGDFLNNGYRIGLSYRSDRHTEPLTTQQKDYPDRVLLAQGDLNNPDAAAQVVGRITQQYGRIDFLVNPIGGWLGGKRVHEHTLEYLEKMLQIDLKPTFNIMKAVLPVLVDQGAGKIINFSSMAAYAGGEGNAVYAASKAAVSRLSEIAAREYGKDNVQVFLLAPSTIATEPNRKAMPDAETTAWVELKDIADTVRYLCESGEVLSGTVFKMTGEL